MMEIYKIVNDVGLPIMNFLFEFRSNKNMISQIFKYSPLTSEGQQIMESKQLHTERYPFGQNYHLSINLQLPLKNFK